jgi:lipopolysaccharide export system permease protein
MRVLDRYIIKALLGSVVLVLVVLLTLLALFLFINEQGWVGVGNYGNLQALRYVVLNLPATLVQFLPVAALIGSLRALGLLARGSEFTVMRAAGIPVWRIGLSVMLAGLLLIPVVLATSEYLAPPLTQLARLDKAVQRNANISITGRSSAWIPDGAQILRAERLPGEAAFGAITVFELGPDNQLAAVGQAHGAHVTADGRWELEDYVQSRFESQRVLPSSVAAHALGVSASPAFLGAIASDPEDLSLRELGAAMAHLTANGQETRPYRFAYWARIAGIVAIPFALLLALPFAFGTPRSTEGGARMVVGLLFGLAWFLMQRMVESGTIVFGLHPLLLAWLPVSLLATAVLLLMIRLRPPTASAA